MSASDLRPNDPRPVVSFYRPPAYRIALVDARLSVKVRADAPTGERRAG